MSLRRLLPVLAILLAGCSTSRPVEQTPAARTPVFVRPERPLPAPITLPTSFAMAVERGTRTIDGRPGPNYWQQYARYDLTARIDTATRRLDGEGRIVYLNRSPDTLRQLFLELPLNVHAEGVVRNEPAEVTGGVSLHYVAVDGQEAFQPADAPAGTPRYAVNGTRLIIFLQRDLAPGDSVQLDFRWSFTIPKRGAGGRMGYDKNLFFLAYWYPHMAVYDDVTGWFTDSFLSRAEFYFGYGDYRITIDAPAGWLVMATGALENPEEVLAPEVLARMRRAYASDTPIRIAEPDTDPVTQPGTDGRLQWRFRATNVRDVAFSLVHRGFWEGARTPVGDRDGDGQTDYAQINTFWRPTAPRWANVTRYQQHAINYLSRLTGLPYPWPHMTAVEGGGIIGGGMEFPMMTLIGDYNAAGDSALYYVTAHELAHMWIPMIVGPNERRYSWMDEGSTTFAENHARTDFFPGTQPRLGEQESYLMLARMGAEGEIMRWSDYHYSSFAFGIASYSKPATLLEALRGLLGEDVFWRAYRTFIREWAFKHPYPYDLFNTFERVSGRDLDWFWRAWYFETWTLDQAVASVEPVEGGVRITVKDHGLAPMPVYLTLTLADGSQVRDTIDVDVWLEGRRRVTVTVPTDAAVTQVEIDPDRWFPDIDRTNNIWRAPAGTGQQ